MNKTHKYVKVGQQPEMVITSISTVRFIAVKQFVFAHINRVPLAHKFVTLEEEKRHFME